MEYTEPTGDIKTFIGKFNVYFDKEYKALKSLKDNIENIYNDAISKTTNRTSLWPNDPSVVTLGDLFKYMFPDMNSSTVNIPSDGNMGGGYVDTEQNEIFKSWKKEILDNDPVIKTMFTEIKKGLNINKKILEYENLAKSGYTNPDKHSPGQYWFDVFMNYVIAYNIDVSEFSSNGLPDGDKLDYLDFIDSIYNVNVRMEIFSDIDLSLLYYDDNDNEMKSKIVIDGKDVYANMYLYKAMLKAGNDYKPVVLPYSSPNKMESRSNENEVENVAVNKNEEVIELTFNVEKLDSFLVMDEESEYSNVEFTLYEGPIEYNIGEIDYGDYDEEDFDEFFESEFLGSEEDYIQYEMSDGYDYDSDGESYSETLEFEPYEPGKHELDLVPGTYVDNSGNKLQLCVIDGKPVNVKIADSLLDFKQAASDAGFKLTISSGFRSPYDTIKTKSASGKKVEASSQKYLYDGWVAKKSGFNLAAEPGKSNHGNGIAIDFNTGSRAKGTLKNDMYVWMVKNSWRFGFVRSVRSEEWHFDYRPDLIESRDTGKPYARLNGTNSNLFFSDLGLDKLV